MLKNYQIEQYIKKDYPSYRIEQVAKHLKSVIVTKTKGFFKKTKTEKIYGFVNETKITVNEIYTDYFNPRENYRKNIGILTIHLAFNEDDKIIYWKNMGLS